jgi:hypothetical protein
MAQREMFSQGKKEAQRLRTSLKMVALAGEELATFVEVQRYPEADARARHVRERLIRSLDRLKLAVG